ncbi:ADP-ribosylation factor [Lentinula raphanica]|nr:ADP-ribosylation factor [Lentinula raphanica]
MLNLLDCFFPNRFRYRVGLSGLDACGKTTLIYKLKYGEVVETIPTIGVIFTTANLNIPCPQGTLRCTVWETGAPGCSPKSWRSKIKSVLTPSAAIVWLVDGADHDRLVESVEELQDLVTPEGSNTLSMNAPILILATKQDLPNTIPLDEIRRKVEPVLSGREAAVFGVSLTREEGFGDLLSAFDWLQSIFKNSPLPEPARATSSNDVEDIDKKLDFWVSRSRVDSSPEEFLSQFHSISLPSWDHYTHVRLAYVILITFGRRKGKDMIFDGIEKYIRTSSQTRGRTFHVTMTYFWIQIVHFGICNVSSSSSLDAGQPEWKKELDGESQDSTRRSSSTNDTLTANDTSSVSDASSSVSTISPDPRNEFARFLQLNPFVVQGNLWEEYYSRDVIMSPEAKQGMVLPDKKPLPSLILQNET